MARPVVIVGADSGMQASNVRLGGGNNSTAHGERGASAIWMKSNSATNGRGLVWGP
jgi:hypothetical protein